MTVARKVRGKFIPVTNVRNLTLCEKFLFGRISLCSRISKEWYLTPRSCKFCKFPRGRTRWISLRYFLFLMDYWVRIRILVLELVIMRVNSSFDGSTNTKVYTIDLVSYIFLVSLSFCVTIVSFSTLPI